ncbi:MarR family winged helix-turn-helix transcriptional regulator [Salidesulfovibrio onnuriiensis]|uniref:MarR family winged helix-turn-helix transcriptional regulator n=1 Tax=Salidesulfovibrio onnuriiensis TaxID=2583823 RepID=UPI0011C9A85E|nr:MarR family transcriptional regulator [Salidesulfovibrio onnuriiensis]
MFIERLKPKESIGFLLYKAARISVNALSARLEEAGVDISVEQWRLLIPLSRYQGISQGELAVMASQEKTGVSRLVAGLESKGYLRREDDENDRRIKRLFVTDVGLDLLARTVEVAQKSNRDVVQGIDPGEMHICKRVLRQLILNHLDDSDCASLLREEFGR